MSSLAGVTVLDRRHAWDLVFTIPHLDGYPALLVPLDRAEPDALADLVTECWDACRPTKEKVMPDNKIAVGDRVSWNTEQGRTRGEVVQEKTKAFTLAGHRFTASADEPMYVVKSEKTGKTAAHKPTALRVLKK